MINHVEGVWRPGEIEVARAAFDVLGFFVSELSWRLDQEIADIKDWQDTDVRTWLWAFVNPESANGVDNIFYASEVPAEQQRYEDALRSALASDAELAASAAALDAQRRKHPQFFPHYGMAVPSLEEWEQRVERIQRASKEHPLLAGRIEVVAIFRPEQPDAVTPHVQAFVQTDAFALGYLDQPLMFELQFSPTAAFTRAFPMTPQGQSGHEGVVDRVKNW